MKFPIPSDWDGVSWCQWAICWPDSELWNGLLRGLITLPMRGRTWDERSGSIIDTQSIGRDIAEKNLPLRGVFMACDDVNLIASFNAIAAAIRYAADRQCCVGGGGVSVGIGGSGIVGTTVQPGSSEVIPIYGSHPPMELLPDTTFPEGFDDLEQWNTHKCSVANAIMDGVGYTLQGLSTLNLLNINVLGVLALAAIAGVLVFPPSAIAVMIGALLALAGVQELLLDARDYLITNREDYVCWLYGATSVSQLIGIIADALDLLVAFIGATGPIGGAVKLILLLLFNGDTLNQLFDSNADYMYPDADCSGCQPVCYEYGFAGSLGAWGSLDSFRVPSWVADDDGSMLLDGRGAGGNNWSYAQISSADIASSLGVDVSELLISSLTLNYTIRCVDASQTVMFGVTVNSDVATNQSAQTNLVDMDLHDVSFSPSIEGALESIYVWSGNNTISSGYVLQTLVLSLEVCLE